MAAAAFATGSFTRLQHDDVIIHGEGQGMRKRGASQGRKSSSHDLQERGVVWDNQSTGAAQVNITKVKFTYLA